MIILGKLKSFIHQEDQEHHLHAYVKMLREIQLQI